MEQQQKILSNQKPITRPIIEIQQYSELESQAAQIEIE